MLRPIALLAATLLPLAAAPALAGPAETAFLQKLNANWVGQGSLVGAQSGRVACRIDISSGGQKLRYVGRCNIPDLAAQAFTGSITYNDSTRRYEVRTVGGTVAGVRRGNALTFTTSSSSASGSADSVMTLSPTSLVVDLTLTDRRQGTTTSHIVFSH